MEINLASIRQEYTKGGLRESELPDNPFLLFSQWLQEAIDSKVDEPTAMLVGTVSPEGKPSTRTVYNPQNHPNEFLKRNGLIFVGMLKRSGSILDKIQWH